jgi:hypothetical protein
MKSNAKTCKCSCCKGRDVQLLMPRSFCLLELATLQKADARGAESKRHAANV